MILQISENPLFWLNSNSCVFHSSSSLSENVPVELREPFYKDQFEQEHLKPSVTKLLLSPETYCRAQALLAQAHGDPPPASQGPPADTSSLLQLLVKRGVAPKVQDVDITEEDLSNTPIKMASAFFINVQVFPVLLKALLFLNGATFHSKKWICGLSSWVAFVGCTHEQRAKFYLLMPNSILVYRLLLCAVSLYDWSPKKRDILTI